MTPSSDPEAGRPEPRAAGPRTGAVENARRLLPFDVLWYAPAAAEAAVRLVASGDDWEVHIPAAGVPSALKPAQLCRIDVQAADSGVDSRSDLGREILARGLRSLLIVPVSASPDAAGGGHVGFASVRDDAFPAAQEESARALAELLAATFAGTRALSAEREARNLIESIGKLLPTVAATLDIREVFLQVSEIARDVIAHDAIGMQLIELDRKTIVATIVDRGHALDDQNYTMSYELKEFDMIDAVVEDVRPETAADDSPLFVSGRVFPDGAPAGVPLEVRLDAKRSGFVREHGFRSFLRTTLRCGDEKIGALMFSATKPGQFHAGQFRISRRIADLVAMALAHRRLADEAARAAEVRARAAMLEQRVQELVQQAEEREGFHRCVGESRAWKDVLSQATRVAATDTTVLLTGESGTGKEVVARFIHRGSPRAGGPLLAVNCAALPEQLLESELFGYERGAFSGALTAKPGRIEQAARGVLFLDEIGEMSPALQAKLLRVLQEREFQRLGGTRTLKADVRIIAATNRDLVAAMKRGEFREDLFYRLRVFEIRLPPLRERRDDVLPLTEAFLADLAKTLGHRTAGLSREAREILLSYEWPGNVRELRNALERAVILCDGGLITGEQLPLPTRDWGRPGDAAAPLSGGSLTIDSAEKALIEKALLQARNNKSKAARLLGLSRAQLYFRLEKYGLVEGTGARDDA